MDRQVFFWLFLLSVLSFFPLVLFFGNSYLHEGSIHLGMFSFAMFFLWKGDIGETLKSLGIPGNMKKNVVAVFAGFAAIMLIGLLLGIAADAFGFNDEEAIWEKISALPFYIILAAAFVAPISEEIFFRALLTPRFGVVLSSLAFGLSHFSYGSVVEVAGATLIGVVLALIYRHTKSIVPSMAIHFLYNLAALVIMRLVM